MALKPFNSIGGYSVGDSGNTIIDSSGNIVAQQIGNATTYLYGDGSNITAVAADTAVLAQYVTESNQSNITSLGNLLNLTVTANTVTNSILTDNYLYANGTPINFNSNGSSNITQVNAGTGLSGGGSNGAVILNIANTGVANGSYGSSNTVATYTVNDQGQLTASMDVAIAIAVANVTDAGTMATQNANSVEITGGNVNANLSGDGSNITNIIATSANALSSFGTDLGVGPNYGTNDPAVLFGSDDVTIRTGGTANTGSQNYGELFLAASETAWFGQADNLVDATYPTYNTTVEANSSSVTTNIGSTKVLIVDALGANVTGDLTATYLHGDGSNITGLPPSYTDANVFTYLGSNSNVVITTTGDITTNGNVTANGNVNTTTVGTTAIMFADGTIQDTAYIPGAGQVGYFTEIPQVEGYPPYGEAAVLDDLNNAYISTAWYNGNYYVPQITKFDQAGAKLWSKDLSFPNLDSGYIISITYNNIGADKFITVMGYYYDSNTSHNNGFATLLSAETGDSYAAGTYDTVFNSTVNSDVYVYDGVFDVEGGNPTFTSVGQTYGESVSYTLTPVAPSGTGGNCYVTWTDWNNAGILQGSQLVFIEPSTAQDGLNSDGALQYYTTAYQDGGPSNPYFNIIVSYNSSGVYSIVRLGGSGGDINTWPDPVTLRILGSQLGGVDGVNDMTVDFSKSVFNNDYRNLNAFTNIQGTAIDKVYLPFYNNFDFTGSVGIPSPFKVNLNAQAFVNRLGGTQSFSKSIGGSDYEYLYGVTNDSSGNVYACGYYYDNNTGKQAAVMSFDNTGALRWSVYIDPAIAIGITAYSIDIDLNGDLLVTAGRCAITKMNPSNGAIIWQTYLTSSFNWDNDVYGSVTPEGDYVIAGINSNDNPSKMYITRFSGVDGSVMWQKGIARANSYMELQRREDGQYINANATKISIAANYYDNGLNQENGLAIEIPSDGNCNGTYGVYTISDASYTWELQSTTSASFSAEIRTESFTANAQAPSISNANLTFNTIAIGTSVLANIIYNGTSNVSIPTADGNAVVSIGNANMTWTFADDRRLYSQPNRNFELVATDSSDGGYTVKQTVIDGSNNVLASTEVDKYDFNILLDVQNNNYRWNFNNNQLSVPTNGTIRGFDTNIVIEAMNSGSNPVASLRSVSNANDPNVFTTFDAATSGANITVWNGGSVGGTANTWSFDTTGNLNLPGLSTIENQGGTFTLYPDRGNPNYNLQSFISYDNDIHLQSGNIDVGIALGRSYGSGAHIRLVGNVASNPSDTIGNIVVHAQDYSGGTAEEWQFGTDGNLTVPGNIITQNIGFAFTANVTGINLGSNVYVNLDSSPFGGPEQGRVAITGVVGTTEINNTWYYQASDPNQFELFTDNTFSTPVDGSAWGAYVSGGVATAVSQANLTILAGTTTISSDSAYNWSFDTTGNLTLPGNTFAVNYANGTPVSLGGGGSGNALINGTNSFTLGDSDQARLTLANVSGSQALLYSDGGSFYIDSLNGNLVLTAGDAIQARFDTAGSLTIPNLVSASGFVATATPPGASNVIQYGTGNITVTNDGGWVIGEYNGTTWGTEGIRISPAVEGNAELNLPGTGNTGYTGNTALRNYNSNVQIDHGTVSTYFDNTGNIVAPGNIITTGSAGDITMTGGNINDVNIINLSAGGEGAGTSVIQVANGYPTIYAYGLGGHGGPEIDWSNAADASSSSFNSSSVYRNVLYLNGEGLYVGINANGANVPGTITANLQMTTNGYLNYSGNVSAVGSVLATTVSASGNVLGNTITVNNLSSIQALTNSTATVAQTTLFTVDSGNYEFLIKGNDTDGGTFYMATISTTSSGDYAIYGTVGNSLGSLSVTTVGGISVLVSPVSDNNITWTAQVRSV